MRAGAPYQNIFFYFRGPSASSAAKSEQSWDRQVEDNTTKALVNVLNHSEPNLTTRFVREFVEPLLDEASSYEYFLQGGASGATKTRWLLGISVSGKLTEEPDPEPQGSRVDAAVRAADDWLVVIEVKVGASELVPKQVAAHAKEWSVPAACWRTASWPDIARWVSGLRREPWDPTTAFLLAQFEEYLRLVGLTSFSGFDEGDFAFFAEPTPERATLIKGRLRAVWEQVLETLGEPGRDALEPIHVGQIPLSDPLPWAQTNRGRNAANLTIELHADRVDLNLVGWRDAQARQIREWLQSNGETVRMLSGYQIVVYGRRAFNFEKRDSGAKPWWQKEHLVEAGRQESSAFSTEWLGDVLAEFGQPSWEKPAFHLRRSWSRIQVLDLGERLGAELAGAVQELLPVLREIRGESPAARVSAVT